LGAFGALTVEEWEEGKVYALFDNSSLLVGEFDPGSG
jgi:hypothetical protein